MYENCRDAHARPHPLAGPATAPTPTPDYTCVCTLTVQGLTIVELFGEIDLAAAGLVSTHLDQVTATARPRILVDLHRVSFIDAGGLGPLVRARDRALRRGGELSLVCTDPRILRTLRLAGLLPGSRSAPHRRGPNWPDHRGHLRVRT